MIIRPEREWYKMVLNGSRIKRRARARDWGRNKRHARPTALICPTALILVFRLSDVQWTSDGRRTDVRQTSVGPSDVRRTSVGRLWDVRWTCVGRPWDVRWTSIGHPSDALQTYAPRYCSDACRTILDNFVGASRESLD